MNLYNVEGVKRCERDGRGLVEGEVFFCNFFSVCLEF